MNKNVVRYKGMIRVEQEYTKSGLSDTEFAASMSSADVTYSVAQVRQWRKDLGIPNNTGTPPMVAVHIAELKALLAECLPILRCWANGTEDGESLLADRVEEAIK
jgi:hypothetical protein